MPTLSSAGLDEQQHQVRDHEEDGEPHPPAIADRQERATEHQERQADRTPPATPTCRVCSLEVEIVPEMMSFPPGGRGDHRRRRAHAVDNITICSYLRWGRHPSTYPYEEMTPMSNFKVADLKLADKGRLRIEWAESPHAGADGAAREVQGSKPLKGHAHRRLPPRHQGDRGPHPHAARRRRRGLAGRAATRCRPRTTSPPRSPPRARRSTPGTASTRKSSTGASTRRSSSSRR